MTPEQITALSTAELDALIALAGKERTRRSDPLPAQAPQQFDATFNPAWFVFLAGDNSVIQLRHAGFGWVSVMIPPAERAHLASLLMHHSLLRGLAIPSAQPVPVTPVPSPAGGGGSVH